MHTHTHDSVTCTRVFICSKKGVGGRVRGLSSRREWADRWTGGWVCEVWARERARGSVGFEFARVGEGGDNGGVKVYEAYEVKIKGGKLRCLLLRRIFF